MLHVVIYKRIKGTFISRYLYLRVVEDHMDDHWVTNTDWDRNRCKSLLVLRHCGKRLFDATIAEEKRLGYWYRVSATPGREGKLPRLLACTKGVVVQASHD